MIPPEEPPANEFTLEQLKAGEPAAWNRAFASFYNLILNVLNGRGYPLSEQDLEDVTIASMTKLIDSYAETVQSLEEVSKLVLTIAKHQVMDMLAARKSEKRGGGKVESLEGQPAEQQYQAETLTPAQNVERAEMALLVNQASKQLPKKYADVLTDFYFLGLKHQEIADKRGLKLGLIGVYLQRALDLLEPLLQNLDLL